MRCRLAFASSICLLIKLECSVSLNLTMRQTTHQVHFILSLGFMKSMFHLLYLTASAYVFILMFLI